MFGWIHKVRTRMITLFAAIAMLAGCQEVLYSELSETDANEMVALLVFSGISAKRERDANQTYSVKVDEADLPVAVTVLKNSGLPREKFSSMGEVFGDSGVVGTPFEERVRFAFATNEELSATITQIKGVERARVHVVVPPEDRFGKAKEPARAAVAIFHDKSFDPASYAGRIKTLVAYAVPGLEVEAVATSFFLTPGFVVQPTLDAGGSGAVIAGTGLSTGVMGSNFPFIGLGMVLIAVLLIRAGMLFYRGLGWGRDPS